MLEPDAAVILDTETTDLYGAVIEIAVIDACTGKTLLGTLVNPGDVRITEGAFAVHGITESQVIAPGVPDWPTVYKRLLRVTKDRTVLAYNAFTRQVDCRDWSCRASRQAIRRAAGGRPGGPDVGRQGPRSRGSASRAPRQRGGASTKSTLRSGLRPIVSR